MRLIQECPPGAVVRAWCPKRSEEDVLWVRVAARRGGTGAETLAVIETVADAQAVQVTWYDDVDWHL
jgi:hypothetical protein